MRIGICFFLLLFLGSTPLLSQSQLAPCQVDLSAQTFSDASKSIYEQALEAAQKTVRDTFDYRMQILNDDDVELLRIIPQLNEEMRMDLRTYEATKDALERQQIGMQVILERYAASLASQWIKKGQIEKKVKPLLQGEFTSVKKSFNKSSLQPKEALLKARLHLLFFEFKAAESTLIQSQMAFPENLELTEELALFFRISNLQEAVLKYYSLAHERADDLSCQLYFLEQKADYLMEEEQYKAAQQTLETAMQLLQGKEGAPPLYSYEFVDFSNQLARVYQFRLETTRNIDFRDKGIQLIKNAEEVLAAKPSETPNYGPLKKDLETYKNYFKLINPQELKIKETLQQYDNIKDTIRVTYKYQNKLQHWLAAVDTLTSAFEQYPKHPALRKALAEAYGELSIYYLAAEDYAYAEELTKLALKMSPRQKWIFSPLAIAFAQQGNLEKAEMICKELKGTAVTDDGGSFDWRIRKDLQILEEAGINGPGLEKIREWMQ
jgi:tetratricopeptide (TPR) repeat protein